MANSSKTSPATVTPTLRYRDAAAAIDWLGKAFGFEPHLVVPGDGERIAHAQLVLRPRQGCTGRQGADLLKRPKFAHRNA